LCFSNQGIDSLINRHSYGYPLDSSRPRNGLCFGFTGFWGFSGSLGSGRLSYGLKNDLISNDYVGFSVIVVATLDAGATKLDPLAIDVFKGFAERGGINDVLTIPKGGFEDGFAALGLNGLGVAHIGNDGTFDILTGIN
jgi:hypothetical protein